MKYRKKPIVIDATQWFKNGDHPEDGAGEGSVVRFFRDPRIAGDYACQHCETEMHRHGWIDTPILLTPGRPSLAPLEGGHVVCPGDWIIAGIGEHYPIKPDIFEATYEEASDLLLGDD